MAANFSVEEVIEMVTADSDVDENEEFKESDTFEDVMRQKLDELGEYAVEIHLQNIHASIWLGLL